MAEAWLLARVLCSFNSVCWLSLLCLLGQQKKKKKKKAASSILKPLHQTYKTLGNVSRVTLSKLHNISAALVSWPVTQLVRAVTCVFGTQWFESVQKAALGEWTNCGASANAAATHCMPTEGSSSNPNDQDRTTSPYFPLSLGTDGAISWWRLFSGSKGVIDIDLPGAWREGPAGMETALEWPLSRPLRTCFHFTGNLYQLPPLCTPGFPSSIKLVSHRRFPAVKIQDTWVKP